MSVLQSGTPHSQPLLQVDRPLDRAVPVRVGLHEAEGAVKAERPLHLGEGVEHQSAVAGALAMASHNAIDIRCVLQSL